MIKLLLTSLLLSCALAYADQTTQVGVGVASQAGSFAGAANQGVSQGITFNSPGNIHTDGKLSTAPTVYAPSLTTSGDGTCSGSSSGSASWLGAGGSAATTYQVEECVRRLNAREVAVTLGDREVAREILCGSPMIYEAYRLSDQPCRLNPSMAVPFVPGGYVVSDRKVLEVTRPLLKVVQGNGKFVPATIQPVHKYEPDELAQDTEKRLKSLDNRIIQKPGL